jgi:hypothetical protein
MFLPLSVLTWNDHKNLDVVRGRFIQLRIHGTKGAVFGVTLEDRA